MSKPTPKRYMVTVTEDFYNWLVKEAAEYGLPVATFSTLLMNEAKKARESQKNMQILFDKMKQISSDQLGEMLKMGMHDLENNQLKLEG